MGFTDWTFDDSLCPASPPPGPTATNCASRNTPWPSTLYIRVTRTTSGPSCDAFTLTVTRM
jgi:hypothetical protein